jgi:synaptobrevin family protein YKT6
MKVICISIYEKSNDAKPNDAKPNDAKSNEVKLCHTAKNLKHVGYFQKSPIEEFINFISKTIVERVNKGTNECLAEKDYKCHVYLSDAKFACVVVTDAEYPSKTAFQLVHKVLEKFPTEKNGIDAFLCNLLIEYQDPAEVDPIISLSREIDETKETLHRSLDSLLKRGENLDELVKKSEELSMTSKTFYIKAKKMNSCCNIL